MRFSKKGICAINNLLMAARAERDIASHSITWDHIGLDLMNYRHKLQMAEALIERHGRTRIFFFFTAAVS